MTGLLVMSFLVATPTRVVTVAPVVADGPVAFAPALQSLIEWDLSTATGLEVRTDDQVAVAVAGGEKAKGAQFLVVTSAVALGKAVVLAVKVVDTSNHLAVGATRVTVKNGAWDDARTKLVTFACETLGAKPGGIKPGVTQELLDAWAAAVTTTDPKKSRDAVAAVAKKWPDFAPAAKRLAYLDGR